MASESSWEQLSERHARAKEIEREKKDKERSEDVKDTKWIKYREKIAVN